MQHSKNYLIQLQHLNLDFRIKKSCKSAFESFSISGLYEI